MAKIDKTKKSPKAAPVPAPKEKPTPKPVEKPATPHEPHYPNGV
tara:strand:- start:8103 stop:8234 length:132 start_codon:yes stop_codon:yes gene_type:complete